MKKNITFTPGQILLKIYFEDNGQDILDFVVSFYPDYKFGTVRDCNAQKMIWTQYSVLSGKPEVGQQISISKSPQDETVVFSHQIIRIENVAAFGRALIPGTTPSFKDNALLAEFLKDIKNKGNIFASGLEAGGIKWIAKVSDGSPDWAIYRSLSGQTDDYIKGHGRKVKEEKEIRKYVPCTDEVFNLYRH